MRSLALRRFARRVSKVMTPAPPDAGDKLRAALNGPPLTRAAEDMTPFLWDGDVLYAELRDAGGPESRVTMLAAMMCTRSRPVAHSSRTGAFRAAILMKTRWHQESAGLAYIRDREHGFGA
jgi:hypothetical protein